MNCWQILVLSLIASAIVVLVGATRLLGWAMHCQLPIRSSDRDLIRSLYGAASIITVALLLNCLAISSIAYYLHSNGPVRTPSAGQPVGSIGRTDSEDAYHPRAP